MQQEDYTPARNCALHVVTALIGAGAFGWSAWPTAVAVASIVPGLLGLIRVSFG